MTLRKSRKDIKEIAKQRWDLYNILTGPIRKWNILKLYKIICWFALLSPLYLTLKNFFLTKKSYLCWHVRVPIKLLISPGILVIKFTILSVSKHQTKSAATESSTDPEVRTNCRHYTLVLSKHKATKKSLEWDQYLWNYGLGLVDTLICFQN